MSRTTSHLLMFLVGAATSFLITFYYYSTRNPQEEPEQQSPCNAVEEKAITWELAKQLSNKYYYGTGCKLQSGEKDTLKGWFLERCIIEHLFEVYSQADGLQLYVGENRSGEHQLVWMASRPIILPSGNPGRENLISEKNTVFDHTTNCPPVCPDLNSLP